MLTSDRGKAVRADFSRLEGGEPGRRLEWRQELAETPFERLLSEARLEIDLEPQGEATEVRMRSTERMRGLARLGRPWVRRAARGRLDEALDGIERALGVRAEPGP